MSKGNPVSATPVQPAASATPNPPTPANAAAAPSRPTPGQPIGIDETQGIHGGVENTPAKTVDEWLADLKARMEKKGIKFDTGNPQARFDEGSGAPIIKSELRKSGATGAPANPGRIKITPADQITIDPNSALAKNPEALQKAIDLYNVLNKGKKVSVGDLMK